MAGLLCSSAMTVRGRVWEALRSGSGRESSTLQRQCISPPATRHPVAGVARCAPAHAPWLLQRQRCLHTGRVPLFSTSTSTSTSSSSSSSSHPPSATAIDTPTETVSTVIEQASASSPPSKEPAKQYTVLRMLDEMGKGKVLQWHKQPGDHVEAGEVICDIDTEVAEFEFNAQYSGFLAVQLVPAGHHVQPNQELALQVDSEDAIEYARSVAKQMQAEEQQEKKADEPR